MKFQGITVKELAMKSGISANTLNMYIGYRETMPLAETGLKIARALGVPLEYLVFGEEDFEREQKQPLSEKFLLQNELTSITSKLSEKQLKNFVKIAKLYADSAEK